MRRLLVIPLAMLLLLSGAFLWSGNARNTPADFTFVNRGDIKTLDPNRMSWMQDIRIALGLWEGFYRLNPRTLEPELGTADRVDISPDRKTYTFHIRPDAAWSNGDPVVAHDFVFAWRRMLEEAQEYTYLCFTIRGAKAYEEAYAKDARSADFSTVALAELDDRTLRVELENPVPYFPDLCAFPALFPQHEKSMAAFKQVDPSTGRYTYAGQFTRPPNLVSNGPYRLDAWQFKGTLRMAANEHYWDRANVKSKIIDQVYGEGQIAFEMYERGTIDWLSEVPPEIAASLRAKGRTDLRVFPAFGTYFYSFNCQPTLPGGAKNPLADARVRRALSMAVDKTPIVETVTRMGEPTTTTYIPRDVFKNFHSPPGIPYDPAGARRLLAEAGYPGGRDFPKLTILFNNEMHHGEVAQVIRRQWLTQLGVDVALEGVEIKVFGERLHSQQYSIARASWYGDYNDPSTFTDKYLSYSDQNDSKWASAEYDAICQATAKQADPAARLRLFENAEDLLLKEAPILPLYAYVNVWLMRDNVVGMVPNAKNMTRWQSVYVER